MQQVLQQVVRLQAPVQAAACRARAAASASRRARRAVRVQAEAKPQLDSVDDANINAFCSLDEQGRRQTPLTLGEKEQLFLEALAAFYYDGKPSISDEEFDNLKDELVWSGSKVAVLSTDEQRFLEAQIAFNRGRPIMTNDEFDALRLKLKQSNSFITLQGPRCSLRSKNMYSDASVDYIKMTLINFPASLVVLGGLFSIDDLTGFEITKFLELPEPYGILILWGFVLPVIYVLATSITNLVFKDALILKAPCPNCGTEATTYFGDILTVAGNRDKNTIQCSNCKSSLTFDANKREVMVNEAPAA